MTVTTGTLNCDSMLPNIFTMDTSEKGVSSYRNRSIVHKKKYGNVHFPREIPEEMNWHNNNVILCIILNFLVCN